MTPERIKWTAKRVFEKVNYLLISIEYKRIVHRRFNNLRYPGCSCPGRNCLALRQK